MKTLLILITCIGAGLTLAPKAEAGYQRTVMGYDSRGNPIIRVVWVADHLDYPRVNPFTARRTYLTSYRRDVPTGSPFPLPPPPVPYSAYYSYSQ